MEKRQIFLIFHKVTACTSARFLSIGGFVFIMKEGQGYDTWTERL